MKKIVLLFMLTALVMSAAQAQLKQNVDKSKVKRTEQPPPAPPPVEKTTANTEEVPVYTLTSVKVKIKTGSDNKEFPSNVIILLKTTNTPEGTGNAFSMFGLVNEMRVNSETEIGLSRPGQGATEAGLAAFQSQGARLLIRYSPNFFADAWKIEGISLVLEFKDQHGNLHPTYGNKTIVFGNAYGFLNNEYQIIECFTDGNLSPLTARISKSAH